MSALRNVARLLLRPIWHSRRLGLLAERHFWWTWIRSSESATPNEFTRRLDPSQPLLPIIARHVAASPSNPVRILDVGAGPVTVLGYVANGRQVEITAVDALADEYNRMLRRRHIEPPVRTQFADAERLSDRFEADTFDVAFAQNSLDHTVHPFTAIEQMVRVVRPGGVVVLGHAIDEAVSQGYTGLHQWNLTERGGHFVLWNRSDCVDVTEALAPACDVRTTRDGDWLDVEITKRR